MNESSVNTLRILTMMIDNKSVPMSVVVRIGSSGSKVDNFSSGGIACGVNEDGTLTRYGYDSKGDKFAQHPNGFAFCDGIVPNLDKALKMVEMLHYRVPVFGVANWDVCIDQEGDPVLIEYNIGSGQVDLHQYNNGPVYGKYKDKIVSEVISDYKIKDATLDFIKYKFVNRFFTLRYTKVLFFCIFA